MHKLIKALYKVVADMSKITIPKGAVLFHGTLEPFSSGLRPGGDHLIWFADSPKIAQLYIPKSGMKMFVGAEDLVKPDLDPIIQDLQKKLGIDYDYDKVEWEGRRLKSWPSPKGWDHMPKEKDIIERMEKLGFKDDRGRYTLRISKQQVMLPNEVQKGKLFIATVKEPLTIWKKSKGESDLMDLQYHDISGFKKAKAAGLDGVLIDDFAQSEEWGNFGHKSLGLFDTEKLSIKSVPAQYREWSREEKGTPEYPNPPEPFFH